MSEIDARRPSSSAHSFLMVPILLLFALIVVAVLRSPSLVTSSGIGSAVIVAAPLILASYALTAIVMAGRGGVDLSIGPLIGFINVTMIQLYAVDVVTSVVDVFLYAIAVGIAYQIIMGLIIYFLRIQPIIVALAGYLTLAGLNLVILPRPGGVAPHWMNSWGLGESIWTPVLAILAAATAAWFLFTRTAFYNHLRLMGADERTAYTAGVNIVVVRLGAHAVGGVYAGLAAICFTALISSGDPTQGSTYTLMAVTALVLGGTSLAGGRGSIIGSLLGALNIYLITYVLATFNFGMVQSFVTQLSYGVILVVALLLTILLPQIQRTMRHVSPYVVFAFLGLAAVGVVLYAQDVVIKPVGQSLVGESLSGQSLSGTSLSGQSLSGESLSGQSLSGTSLSGTSLSAEAEAEAPAEPTATPLVIAAVVIAVAVSLIWLLYRHLSFATVVFIGVVALMVLGYSAYDGGVPEPHPMASAGSWAMERATTPFVFDAEGPPGVFGTSFSFDESSLLGTAVAIVGGLLLGTILIFTTVPYLTRRRVGETSLLFITVTGVIVAAGLVYWLQAGDSVPDMFKGAVGAILVGAMLFVVTLPTFQVRIRDITAVMVTLTALVALVVTFLASVPPPGPEPAPLLATVAAAAPAPAELSDGYLFAVVALLLAAVVLFLLVIPGVRRHVMSNVTLDMSSRAFSYTNLFISLAATVAFGAVLLAAGVPFWRVVIVAVAVLIGSKFAFHFLRNYRTRHGSMPRIRTPRPIRSSRSVP